MPGDVNPSFPIARRLVDEGHAVYYLSPDYQAAIEDTGATFLDAKEYYDLYKEGRSPETFGAANQLKRELGFPECDGEYLVRVKIANIELEKKLDGTLRALEEVKAQTVLYDPVLCREGAIAAEIAKCKAVALLAFNGHGAWAELVHAKMRNDLPAIESEADRIKEFETASLNELNLAATERLNEKYEKHGMKPLDGKFTEGRLDPIPEKCIVTTTDAMKAPQTPDLVGDADVIYTGAMLDVPGALRAGGPTVKDHWRSVQEKMDERKEDGRTIFVSMGTVTTADGDLGWQGQPNSSLTGEQLCQAVWGAAFDALGGEKGSGNVILMTVGKDKNGYPRPVSSSDSIPGNALCNKSMPQVDILSKGVDLFVTHGGQNSFVEAITLQTPMLAVPTVGDQIQNAEQVVEMGIGERVLRPPPSDEEVTKIAADYRELVKGKILSMLSDIEQYKEAVVKASSRYRGGGVDEAVRFLVAPR
eukprot:TRINITY_DN15299_c0_g1_i4.p1 TRINITY_DN15299_c0_g1~~TRINITY_DN15299_c0_g1_i4.p1  ORF type:complete len:475 (+),score=101.55 TRINITY_DN15299_c0_g1_i4:131-1555(+)